MRQKEKYRVIRYRWQAGRWECGSREDRRDGRQGRRDSSRQEGGSVVGRKDRRMAGREGGMAAGREGGSVVGRQGVEGRVGFALSSALTRLVPLPHQPGHYTLTTQDTNQDTIPHYNTN
ncbi:hypothetical protein Pcinc_043921 [Petrolisthes cinctipes]|uniref:Uncharacterized protein n=1 Tax=Petrolisthes cinctipes TaxID=88211 RepID=A0AAE1BF19_PETCI|nr:hypothetical protein Pcinc_043921 [Petrolisthes cinctipes]